MTVMSKEQEALVERLVSVAGDPRILQEALERLRNTVPTPLKLEDIVRVILEIKAERAETNQTTSVG
jgi:hypothetical protein